MLPLFVARELEEGESLARLIYPPKIFYWLSIAIPLLLLLILVFLWWLFWSAGAFAQIFWGFLVTIDLLVMWQGASHWRHEVLAITSRRIIYFSKSFFNGPVAVLDRNSDWSLGFGHPSWFSRFFGYWSVKIRNEEVEIIFPRISSEDRRYLEELY